MGDIKQITEPQHIKKLYRPRRKKLVVFGFQIFCDYTSPQDRYFVRPNLHEFLSIIYKEYDIAIWHDFSMRELEETINHLKMNNRRDYKFKCYLDCSSIIMQTSTGYTTKRKPLSLIWSEYPMFNNTNTIICDDRIDKITYPNQIGVLVLPYFYQRHNSDNELMKLSIYLIHYITTPQNPDKIIDYVTWKKRTNNLP